ncbi:MAG: hypothetical protein MUP40_00080 [Actinobacteria bacterium]|nr:hypothetical protein [Actinomycetota bacterium]
MNNDQVAKGAGTVTVFGITGERVSSKGIALPDGARAIYEQGEVAKFLATASAGGEVNVALIVSQTPTEEGKIVFGDFMMVKTKKNLSENRRVASLAITPKLEMAGFKGDVEGWTDTGPYIDLVNSIGFFRYNAYMGIHNVAPINIREMLALPPKVSFLKVGVDFVDIRARSGLKSGSTSGGVAVPVPVRKKFESIMSIKVITLMDEDGYPNIFPLFSTHFKSPSELRFKVSSYNAGIKRFETPCRMALNVLTLDLFTYQLKGELAGFERSLGLEFGAVRVEEAYSSMPPFCGERIA